MRHIGENGVAMRGSTDWVDGRGGNQPRFNTIDGNLIHHLGLYTKDITSGNVVMSLGTDASNPLRVWAIDFDPQDDDQDKYVTYTGGAPVSDEEQSAMRSAVDDMFLFE